MANWSGTYSISVGATGTSTGSNTTTTFNNTGATWPTGAQSLANFIVRILTGTGAGQERTITSNTATQLTVPAWTTIPDNTSTYEIVLKFKNADHITAALTLSGSIITELEDNATIFFDGNFALTMTTTCRIRWQKTLSTLVTFEPNNKTVQGTMGFWSQIDVQASVSIVPLMEFIKAIGGNNPFLIRTAASGFDGSTVKYLWVEASGASMLSNSGHVPPVSVVTFSRVFARNGKGCRIVGPSTAGTNALVHDRMWGENSFSLGGFGYTATGSNSQILKNSVFKKALSNNNVSIGSALTVEIRDCYLSSGLAGENIMLGHSAPATPQGTYMFSRNVSQVSRACYGAAGSGTGIIRSKFNDYAVPSGSGFRAIEIAAGTSYATAESDNDYMAGNNNAIPENVDTSAATSSSASPSQYRNLTATRTNPKSVRNRPQNLNNVVVGTPTPTSVTVTFDNENGAVSGQGSTTVNSDSASGQPTLNVASVTGFEVGEIVEVGYGTVRFEEKEIASIGASSLTFTTNLSFAHTAAQADTAKKQLRLYGLPFIRYGLASGVYTERTSTPDQKDWGLVFTEINKVWNGQTFDWKMYGHSVTIAGLKPGTTYYAKPFTFDPLGNVIDGAAEFSFTTAANTETTWPDEDDVRLGIQWKENSPTNNKTGTVRVPTVGQVKIGVDYDANDSLEGTYDGSDRWDTPDENDVRLGVAFKENSLTNNRTGTVRVPGIAQVQSGYAYDANDSLVGTLPSGVRPGDPIISITKPDQNLQLQAAVPDMSMLASGTTVNDSSPRLDLDLSVSADKLEMKTTALNLDMEAVEEIL